MTPLQAALRLLERSKRQGLVKVHEKQPPPTRGNKSGKKRER